MRPNDTITRRRLLTVGAGLGTAALAGCVGARRDPDYTPPTATSTPAEAREGEEESGSGPELSQSATVDMVSASDGSQVFEPDVVWLEPGGTATWVNDSGGHTATAYAEANGKPDRIPADAEPWDSGMITEIGAEFTHTFEVEGIYDYFCLPHEALAMLGTVVVGEPDPADQPGVAPPQSSLPDGAAEEIERLNAAVTERLGE